MKMVPTPIFCRRTTLPLASLSPTWRPPLSFTIGAPAHRVSPVCRNVRPGPCGRILRLPSRQRSILKQLLSATAIPPCMTLACNHLYVAVLVPCYNEEPTIQTVIEDFCAALPGRQAGAVVRQERAAGEGKTSSGECSPTLRQMSVIVGWRCHL